MGMPKKLPKYQKEVVKNAEGKTVIRLTEIPVPVLTRYQKHRLNNPLKDKADYKPKGPQNGPSDPLKGQREITKVRNQIGSSKRNHCLFTVGINFAFRAGDLLSLKLGDVRDRQIGDSLRIKEEKTQKWRTVMFNTQVVQALADYLPTREGEPDTAPLFPNEDGEAITVELLGRLIKTWTKKAGLRGNYSTHTLRKTFGYTLRTQNKTPIEVIQKLYGHSSPQTTHAYIAIQTDELQAAYMIGIGG